MAVQLFAYAKSKGYDVKLYADTTQVSYNPFEFTVADWKVTYDTQDAYKPGIVASRMELIAPITQGTLTQNLETILQDGDGTFYMTLSKNLGDMWKGYCTPSAGSIEVINGQRFITLIAADGFQLLNLASDGYTFTGTKAFSTQIAEVFNRLGFWQLFNGFLVSKDITRVYNSSALYDSLYLCGSGHNGVYNTDTTFHTFKDVIEGILVAFGLRMYQDKGYIVFQDFTRLDSSFNVYTPAGTYQTNIDYTGSQTMQVISGGTKMYLPPVRLTEVQHLYPNQPYENETNISQYTRHTVWTTPFEFETYNWVDLGTVFADGVTHLDYDISLRAVYTIPAYYPSQSVSWDFRVYFWLGEYSTDGTTWTKTDQYIRYTVNQHIDGDDPEPQLGLVTTFANNNHLPTFPNIGEVSLGLTVELVQASGDEIPDPDDPQASWNIYQHGAGAPYRGYRADNSRRKLGEDVTFTTRIGDLSSFGVGAEDPQQIIYVSPSQTVKTWPQYWLETLPSGEPNYNRLLQITANRIGQRRSIPLEYYELDLHETSAVTHTASWGGVDYFPVNIEYNYEGSRVTYAKIVNLPVNPDPLRFDPEL